MKLQLLIALTVLAARATLIIPDLAKAQTSIESYNNAQSYHCCYGRVRQKFLNSNVKKDYLFQPEIS